MIAVAAVGLVAAGTPMTALGDGPNTSIANLSADWWQWVLEAPVETNPNLDPDGRFSHIGQTGQVWHLAGAFGGKVERWCVVPAGKSLFVPIVNNVWVSWPQWHPSPDPIWHEPYDGYATFEDWARDLIAAWIDTFDPEKDLYLRVDKEEIPILDEDRVESPSFMVFLPENNLFGEPSGLYGPCASDGYFVLLDPLPPGEHTIEFGAKHVLKVVCHVLVVGDN